MSNNNSVEGPIKTGQIISLKIDDLNGYGQGVGRVKGLVVFVNDAVIGDLVEVQITSVKKNYATAAIRRLVSESENRIKPRCPLAGVCGGCVLQSTRYESQLAWKDSYIKNLMQRIGRQNEDTLLIKPIIGMANPWFYRGKVQMPVSGSAAKPLIGFYERGSHQVVDGDECCIQHPVADVVRARIRSFMIEAGIQPYNETDHSGLLRHIVVRIGFFTGQVMVVLVLNGQEMPGIKLLSKLLAEDIGSWKPDPGTHGVKVYSLSSLLINTNTARNNLVLRGPSKLIHGQSFIEEIILGRRYRISSQAFFQVNPVQTEILFGKVLELAELQGSETVLDLYCGTGSISLLLATAAASVIGVEIVGAAVADARLNAGLNDVTNVEFVEAAAENWLPEYVASGGRADAAVIDPPRKGCDERLISTLTAYPIPKLIYVSCNPATLARDISLLAEKYDCVLIQPVDMFPHGDSAECIAVLHLR